MANSKERREDNSASQVAGSSLIVMTGLAASFVIGPIQQNIVAGLFGTSAIFDAYTAANILSELLVVALAGGTLVFAFMPVYAELLEQDTPEESDRLFSQVITAIVVFVGVLAIIAALTAPVLVGARGWGLGRGFDSETQQVTSNLIRILMFSTLIFSVSNFVTGTLHAHKHFVLPAISPILYSGGIIFGALFLTDSFGIYGLAWGAVIGAALHLLVQIPGLILNGVRWKPMLNLKNPNLTRVLILMAPRVVDLLMARIAIGWLNSSIASGLGEGRVSALGYSFTLMNFPQTIIGTAIGFAIFPTMAALAAKNDVDAQREALSGTLRAVLTLAIPAAVGMLLLGRPIIQLIFEGGEFTSDSTQLVYQSLQFYMVYMISQSILDMTVRAYAAQQDTYTPLYISFFTTALNIGLALWLSRTVLLHAGLPLANGIAVGVESLIGLTILSRRWNGINVPQILLDTAKAIGASALMAGVIIAFRQFAQPGIIAMILGGGLLGGLTYLLAAVALGIREIITIPLELVNRLLKREIATESA